jgi:hypothetical protein
MMKMNGDLDDMGNANVAEPNGYECGDVSWNYWEIVKVEIESQRWWKWIRNGNQYDSKMGFQKMTTNELCDAEITTKTTLPKTHR